jgi:hypothetical protein
MSNDAQKLAASLVLLHKLPQHQISLLDLLLLLVDLITPDYVLHGEVLTNRRR